MTNTELLRHAVATVAYRAAKVVRDAPDTFGSASAGEGTRTAIETLAHVSDVLEWADRMANGDRTWSMVPPTTWGEDVARFHAACAALDATLAAATELPCPAERLLQGPVADALTHVGQLATLRRLAGSPVRGEDYFGAPVEIGRVGPDQAPPVFEF